MTLAAPCGWFAPSKPGAISVNTGWSVHREMPFGGVKRSGVGRELCLSALEHYSEQKSVFIAEDRGERGLRTENFFTQSSVLFPQS